MGLMATEKHYSIQRACGYRNQWSSGFTEESESRPEARPNNELPKQPPPQRG